MNRFSLGYSQKMFLYPLKRNIHCLCSRKQKNFLKGCVGKHSFTTTEMKLNKIIKLLKHMDCEPKKSPPNINELKGFENDLISLIKNIEFKKTRSKFQNKLKNDVLKINESNEIIVAADKTSNMYEMSYENYDKLLSENITQRYKKEKHQTAASIVNECKSIAKKLHIENRLRSTIEKPAFITIKDHKENFENNMKCRLINPTKTEIGRVSKYILDRINTDIRSKCKLNQWKNTKDAINWFSQLRQKNKLTFLTFDIIDFYPSISDELLNKSIEWARKHTSIDDQEYETIMHSRRTLLHDNKGNMWTKKEIKKQFDVSMGAFDGAEVCELIDLCIISTINESIKFESIGLYRDDGLAVLKSATGSESERMRKRLIKTFQDNDLSITSLTNITSANFLDITLNLTMESYKPYRKPNDQPLYIDKYSNHPRHIIKTLPNTISKRISELSSTKKDFEEAAPIYIEAMKQAKHDCQIKYAKENQQTSKQKNRKRNIICYNPPFNNQVSTNIGKEFFKLLRKYFPKENKLFNKNNIKISYRCTRNMQQIIKAHNAKTINGKNIIDPNGKTCNCRQPTKCPLDGNCLSGCIIYKATISLEKEQVAYIGLTSTTFKERYNNHNKSTNTIYKYKCLILKLDLGLGFNIRIHAPPSTAPLVVSRYQNASQQAAPLRALWPTMTRP